MEINYWLILLCGALSMIIGSVWYGPLFGKKWMQIVGVKDMDEATKKKMQKEAIPLYFIQFILTIFQAFVLAFYIRGWNDVSGVENALWIWGAFILPTIAGTSMWNNDPSNIKWSRFLIQTGYQLVMFIVFGFVLSI